MITRSTNKAGKYLSLMIIFLAAQTGMAQQFSLAITELQKIQNSISGNGYAGFTIKYQYAEEQKPGKILDTLLFTYKMKNGQYHCKVAQIEFLQNDSVNLAVYHKEKTIILSNPSTSTAKGSISISEWDSSFLASNVDSIAVSESNNTKTIAFYFSPESKYSSYNITYNSNNYNPKKISYVERATRVYEEGQTTPNGLIITMIFSNISRGAFDTSVFDEQIFIQNINNQWQPAGAYAAYELVNNRYK